MGPSVSIIYRFGPSFESVGPRSREMVVSKDTAHGTQTFPKLLVVILQCIQTSKLTTLLANKNGKLPPLSGPLKTSLNGFQCTRESRRAPERIENMDSRVRSQKSKDPTPLLQIGCPDPTLVLYIL